MTNRMSSMSMTATNPIHRMTLGFPSVSFCDARKGNSRLWGDLLVDAWCTN